MREDLHGDVNGYRVHEMRGSPEQNKLLDIWRETDAIRINRVLNHPDVRPWVANGDAAVDVSGAVADPKNILLMGEHGGCLFFQVQPGVYEVHTQVLPSGRGVWTNSLTEAVVNWMFLRTPCYEIITRVPEGHVAAKAAATRRGLRYEYTRPKECMFRDKLVDVDIFSFRIQDWIGQAKHLDIVGEHFHELLHAAAARYGVKQSPHENDPNHNRYVGAAIEMVLYGQFRKAVTWYNRWALISRHSPVVLLREGDPAIIRIDSGFVLSVSGGNIEVQHAVA